MSLLTRELHDVLAPLGAEEQQRAIAAALASSGANRETLLLRGAELAIEKSARRGERPHRRVRVLFSLPAECIVREVLVDLNGKVVSDRELGPRNLPFLESEIEQARAVAERDEQVAKRFAGYTVGVGTFAPMLGAAGRHRLVGLHFLDVSNPDLPRSLTSVVVDLTTRQLVHDSHGDDSHGDDARDDAHAHEPREV